MKYSKHALSRLQQRGVNKLMVELVMLYGEEYEQGSGQTFNKLSKAAFKHLELDLKVVINKIEKLKKLYVVESENTIVTSAYQSKHIHNH